MMCFEGLEELHQDLLFGLFSLEDVGVSLGTVDTLDIIDINIAVAVLVELSVGLSYKSLSTGVHGTSDDSEEFIVVDSTTSINIEIVEEALNFRVVETEHVVLHGLGELVDIEGSTVVVIHNSES